MFNSDGSDINKQSILKLISQEDIFEKYLGIQVTLDDMVRNPLRVDLDPTCTFKWIGEKLYFRDWTENKAKDCFDVVKQIYQCNFAQAIDIVAKEFGLYDGKDYQPVKRPLSYKQREPVNLQIKRQPFTTYCTSYWASQGIQLHTLAKYNVFSLRAVWVRNNKVYDWSPKDLAFAYQFSNDLIKVYFPLRKKKGQIRFFNTDNTVLEGFNQLPTSGELLVITKSYKDVMLFDEYQIPAVAPASESVSLNPLIVNILRSRFPIIYSLMDNDWPGRRAAIRIKQQYDIPPIIFPIGEPKDLTDNYKKYGSFYLLDVINDMKSKI